MVLVSMLPTLFVFTFNPLHLFGQQESGGTSTNITTTKKRGHYRLQLKTQQQFDQEFSYWLKFISSNAIPRSSRAHKPLVLIIITHKDRLRSMGSMRQEAFRMAKFKEWMRDVAKKFEHKLVIEEGYLFFVDATNKDDPHLGEFVQTAIRLLRRRINDVPEVPAICESVAKALGGCGGQQIEPIFPVTKFQSLCKSLAQGSTTDVGDQAEALQQLFEGNGNKASKVIAAYLRDAGEVLYIKDLPFLVRNPRRFAHGILRHLIDIFTPYYSSDGHQGFGKSQLLYYLVHLCCPSVASIEADKANELPRADDLLRDNNGLVDKAFLAELLEHAIEIVKLNPDGTDTGQIISLMEKLDLCYQTNGKYLIPALLQDEDGKAERGECKQECDLDLPSLTSKRVFVSRRLQCSDPSRTFITPGFFPRLQVVLHKKIHE